MGTPHALFSPVSELTCLPVSAGGGAECAKRFYLWARVLPPLRRLETNPSCPGCRRKMAVGKNKKLGKKGKVGKKKS